MTAAIIPATKPWWQRSEFWTTIIGLIIGVIQMLHPSTPSGPVAGAIVAGAAGGGYAVSRGLAKYASKN